MSFYYDKVTGVKKHTVFQVSDLNQKKHRIVFFNQVFPNIEPEQKLEILVRISKNYWNQTVSLSLIGYDFKLSF